MRLRRTSVFLVFALFILLAVFQGRAAQAGGAAHADVSTGEWAIRRSDQPGKVDFSLREHHHGGDSSNESEWPMRAFSGVDFSKSERQDVRFTIKRDAGTIECDGFLENGEGTGLFHFQLDPNYAGEMSKSGFSIDEERQYSMAVHDVSLEFARQMKSEHLSGLDADKLISFRIFRVDSAFIDHIDLEELIAFRIHGVSPEFIEKLQALGYAHPGPEQLVAMRIHNVTPEYIAGLRMRGLCDLSIDQLVNLRIQGID